MAIRAATSDRGRAVRCLAVVAALCASAPLAARAQSPTAVPDPVAQALFQDGRDLVDKGQWDAGCTKFEASMLLYPAASTLLNIAHCYEHKSRLASAWSAYKRVQVLNRETIGDERRRAIDEMVDAQVKALTPRLPKIKLTMKSEVAGVTVHKDGEVLPAAVIGTEVPVDVGEHEIVVEAPGRRPFRQRVDVKEGAVRELAVDLVPENEPDPRGDGAHVPAWAWVSGGTGLVMLGLSAGFRVDQAFVEGRQSGKCGGEPCPKSYDPGPDNTRKNVDFALFAGFGVVGALAVGASIFGIVRGTTKPSPAPVAGIIVTRDGAAMSAAFRF